MLGAKETPSVGKQYIKIGLDAIAQGHTGSEEEEHQRLPQLERYATLHL